MFRQKHFILSSSILGLVLYISFIAAFYPGKESVKEVAGVKQELTLTPTKILEEKKDNSSFQQKTTPTLTITKTQSSSSQSNSSTQNNDSSYNANTPNYPNSPQPTIDSPTETQTPEAILTPTDVPVRGGVLTISGNSCSSDIHAVCPSPTPKNGVGSSNTVTLISFPTSTPPNTGGDVHVITGPAVTETP